MSVNRVFSLDVALERAYCLAYNEKRMASLWTTKIRTKTIISTAAIANIAIVVIIALHANTAGNPSAWKIVYHAVKAINVKAVASAMNAHFPGIAQNVMEACTSITARIASAAKDVIFVKTA